MALATAVYPILDLLTATGFNLAIIRMRDPRLEHYDTAWTLGVLRGIFIAAGLVATSGWQARFMHEPRIQPLMWVVAGTALLASLQNVRLIDYRRDLRFNVITWWMIWGKVQVLIITLLLAIVIRNYWILVLGNLLNKFITVPASYFVAPHRPRLSLAGWRDLFGFSKWLFLGNVCLLTDMQLMNFVIGHFLGMSQVGFFQVGRQIAALPVTEIAAPIRAPLYSAFSKIHEDIAALRRTYLDGLSIQCLIVLPLALGVGLTSREVTNVFLGSQWSAVIPLLPVIALYELFDAAGHYIHTVMLALNKQRLYTFTYYASIALRIPLTIWWAMNDGLHGAIMAMLVTAVVNAALWNAQVNRLLHIGWRAAGTWRSGVPSSRSD